MASYVPISSFLEAVLTEKQTSVNVYLSTETLGSGSSATVTEHVQTTETVAGEQTALPPPVFSTVVPPPAETPVYTQTYAPSAAPTLAQQGNTTSPPITFNGDASQSTMSLFALSVATLTGFLVLVL